MTTTTIMMMMIDDERTTNAHRHISIIKRECERQMNDSINRARRRQRIREREREREEKKKNRPLTEGYKQRTRTTRKKREEILRKQEGKKTKFSARTSIVS